MHLIGFIIRIVLFQNRDLQGHIVLLIFSVLQENSIILEVVRRVFKVKALVKCLYLLGK